MPNYSRPPILEALLDVKVDLPSDFTLESLKRCQKQVQEEYPNSDPIQTMQMVGGYSPEKGVTSSASSKPTGYSFASKDRKRLFQAQLDGFTHNHIGPYPGWDKFFAEAQRLWEIYRAATHPRGYKRIALRFINRFDFTQDPIKHEDYFRTYLEVSRDLPQVIGSFFYRFDLLLPEIASVAKLAATTVPPPAGVEHSVLLDIDLIRVEGIEAMGGNEVWELFETLRTWKNKVFEGCITDAARELIL